METLEYATVNYDGNIALPDAVRHRYHLDEATRLRIIETSKGILLVPLTNAPMSAELAAELAAWQALGQDSLDMFPFEEQAA